MDRWSVCTGNVAARKAALGAVSIDMDARRRIGASLMRATLQMASRDAALEPCSAGCRAIREKTDDHGN